MSQCGHIHNIINKPHKILLFFSSECRINSCQVHRIVECYIKIIKKIISEKVSINNNILSEDNFITETKNSSTSILAIQTDLLPLKVNSNLSPTSLNDNGIITDDFGSLL